MKEKNNKGFTLAELLIVIAIIAVLVAIAIPIFNSQLEKAREATDLANIRAAYAECCAAVLTGSTLSNDAEKFYVVESNGNYTATKSFYLKQKKDKWQMGDVEVAGVVLDANKLEPITVISGGGERIAWFTVAVSDNGIKPFFALEGEPQNK